MMGDIMYLNQALQQPDAKEFVQAVIKEVNGHVDCNNWTLKKRSEVPDDACHPYTWWRPARLIFEGALPVYMGCKFFVQWLHEELCSSSKENILQMNMFIILRATDMIAQLHIASIIFITVVIPVRWLAGKTPAWPS